MNKAGLYIHNASVYKAYFLKETQKTCISGFHGEGMERKETFSLIENLLCFKIVCHVTI